MASFLSNANKKVTDVRGFLRDAANGSSIKYIAEKGAKHTIYIPYNNVQETDESGATSTHKEIIAISGAVHEWQSLDGHYKGTVCMKDVPRVTDDGTMLNDGSCPFCDRVDDAWAIYNYRKDEEDNKCKLSGEDRKKHLEKTFGTFADERKAKAARPYMYMLIVKFRVDATGNAVMGTDGLPEFDLKVMKLSSSRVEKIQQQLSNSGCELPGSELIFEYPATDDRRLQVSQSTTAPVFPDNMLTRKYPAVVNKINEQIVKFDWDKIVKSFPEWAGMTTAEAKNITDALFEKWDEYRNELKTRPDAKYMEYITNTPVTEPALGGFAAPVIPGAALPGGAPTAAPVIPGMGAAPTAPVIPNAAPVIPNAAPTAPVIPDAPQAPQAPGVGAVFNGGPVTI